jgi:hypothetical protein
MRRTLSILAVPVIVLAMATPAAAMKSERAAERHGFKFHRSTTTTSALVIERKASPIRRVDPGMDPLDLYPAVTVAARVRGCEPGLPYVVTARFFQNRREITGVSGGLGFEEFTCGDDGTARILQSRYDLARRLHPGRLWVTFSVLTISQDSVVSTTTARVRIPRC